MVSYLNRLVLVQQTHPHQKGPGDHQPLLSLPFDATMEPRRRQLPSSPELRFSLPLFLPRKKSRWRGTPETTSRPPAMAVLLAFPSPHSRSCHFLLRGVFFLKKTLKVYISGNYIQGFSHRTRPNPFMLWAEQVTRLGCWLVLKVLRSFNVLQAPSPCWHLPKPRGDLLLLLPWSSW